MYYKMRENAQRCVRPDDLSGKVRAEGPVLARSVFMRAEEIDQERELSGWNPYAGEEEEIPAGTGQGKAAVTQGDRDTGQEEYGNMPDCLEPYFLKPDYAQILSEEQETERDLRRLQSMYPEEARQMLVFVEEECDKLEYEGSPMFDGHPDHTTVYQTADRIYHQVRNLFAEEQGEKAEQEDMRAMQFEGRKRRGPENGRLRDLARILLLQEMYHRRCRRRRCMRQRPDQP